MKRVLISTLVLALAVSLSQFGAGQTGANLDYQMIQAAYNNDVALAQQALAKGANIETRTKDNETPLIVAAICGSTDALDFFLRRGANVEAKASDGSTALMSAAEFGDPDPVKLLLAKGANVNVRDNDGHTALYFATKEGNTEVVNLLKARGAQ